MSLAFDACRWLYTLPVSTAIRESDWWFSIIESVHVLALALMAGAIALVDLRLLGVALRDQPVSRVLGQVLPLTWVGFALMAASGAMLFASEAEKLYDNWPFRAKLVLLVLAGLNPLVFHTRAYRSVGVWDSSGPIPAGARAAAVASLLLWTAIIVLGRLVAYFH